MDDNEITAIVGWPTEPQMAQFRAVAAAAERNAARLSRHARGVSAGEPTAGGPLATLIDRLIEHADVHDTHAPADAEQRAWANDLRLASAWLDQMRVALQIVHTWASEPRALDSAHTRAICANALRIEP